MVPDRCNTRMAEMSVGSSIETMSQTEDEKTKEECSRGLAGC